jgi:hypothetical protein
MGRIWNVLTTGRREDRSGAVHFWARQVGRRRGFFYVRMKQNAEKTDILRLLGGHRVGTGVESMEHVTNIYPGHRANQRKKPIWGTAKAPSVTECVTDARLAG